MAEYAWHFSVLGLRIGWYKHYTNFGYDKRNRLLDIGKLNFWLE